MVQVRSVGLPDLQSLPENPFLAPKAGKSSSHEVSTLEAEKEAAKLGAFGEEEATALLQDPLGLTGALAGAPAGAAST